MLILYSILHFVQGRTAFQIMFSHSMTVVLHPRLMNEVKSHPHLSFDEAVGRVSGHFMNHSISHLLIVVVIPRGKDPRVQGFRGHGQGKHSNGGYQQENHP